MDAQVEQQCLTATATQAATMFAGPHYLSVAY